MELNYEPSEIRVTDAQQTYLKAFIDLAARQGEAVEWETSVLERRGQALFLKSEYVLPTLLARCRRETAHIHASDASAHVNLSLADAEEVVRTGWGERHRLSGSRFPLNYTMLYQPRKVEEIEVFMSIFEAGIEYAKSNGSKS